MQIRRPIAALVTALALFGGGASMTACSAAGQDQNDGTTDDSENDGGSDVSDEDADRENLPDNSNQEPNDEDDGDDQQDPD
ncbi:hypothetical protein [Blastococcus sp. PRF04-17]|uniref:hypothetical protein n=1 Tax=Blastococcus sp. PRF04-17 TaxID=2933797 RepID=UPI001FF35D0B|nr:hypothetical protein [Blastococcus sp. PRF04-17]UOY02540.1 hypothetical protein MVA48_03945 [Blastococcus sp. PRF04-17]